MTRHFARWAATTVAASVLLALPACYPSRRAEPVVGPMTLADPALQRGRIVYDRYCYKCHTEGEGGLGPILNDKPLPRFLMKLQVRVGLGFMPAFSSREISDEELDDLVNYIVALRHHR
jgi:mono/diheme cytochrome c family protein